MLRESSEQLRSAALNRIKFLCNHTYITYKHSEFSKFHKIFLTKIMIQIIKNNLRDKSAGGIR